MTTEDKEILDIAIREILEVIVSNNFTDDVVDIFYYDDDSYHKFMPEVWIRLTEESSYEDSSKISKKIEKIRGSFYDSGVLHIKDIVYFGMDAISKLEETNYKTEIRNYKIDSLI